MRHNKPRLAEHRVKWHVTTALVAVAVASVLVPELYHYVTAASLFANLIWVWEI